MKQPGYFLNGQRFRPHTDLGQELLAKAYLDKIRPVCLCTMSRPKMYIAFVGGTYYLKRLPGTGQDHAPGCDTFDAPAELSGLAPLEGTAIKIDTEGVTALALDFPLSSRGGRGPIALPNPSEKTSVEAPAKKLTLLSFLHYLWDNADLTKWHPGMAGKRNWFIVRRELLAAAQGTTAKQHALSSVLYIPESFSVKDKGAIAQRRHDFMRPFHRHHAGSNRLAILIAELKSSQPSQYGRKFTFKHMPDLPLFADQKLADRLYNTMGDRMMLAEVCDGAHLIFGATFDISPSGFAEVREITTMPVNEHWIPFNHMREQDWLKQLGHRRFVKSLSYNLGPSAPIASAVLADTDPPTALYCPSPTTTDDQMAELREIAADGVYPALIWSPEMATAPDLPSAFVGP